ncbi:hypothetical protein [Spongiimicrobium salis]|uniref:hypothetical protein n=1 Tax=Spongiimicrobium salis TaxID=1667022 RepID=UPI00374CEE38
MKDLYAIVHSLSKEEKTAFLNYLKRKNRRGDTKNSSLFKCIASGKTKDLDVQLYGKPSRNAYHALCKRLQDSLVDFVASESFAGESSEELDILKLLLASRIFFERAQYTIAFKTLSKAERNAYRYDLYAILNEIYHTKIQYAHLHPAMDLSAVIEAANANGKRYLQEHQLNMAYATIKERLKKEQTKSANTIIKKVFADFHIEIHHTLTYKSLFQLMNITTTAAKLQNDYHVISPFMFEMYAMIKEKESMADKHRFYHIEILHLMAVTNFRNRAFETSKSFVRHMEVEMDRNKRFYYKRFLEKLTLIKALNLNYTGKFEQAIQLLEWSRKDSLEIRFTLLLFFFQQEDFSSAYTILKKMNHSDGWYEKKMGWIWVLKKNILELLLFIELDKLDLVLIRLKRFKQKFAAPLKEIKETRVLVFMTLVAAYYEKPDEVTSEEFRQGVEESITWKETEREDVFVMSFYAWLKAKMEGKSLYKTILDLVHR